MNNQLKMIDLFFRSCFNIFGCTKFKIIFLLFFCPPFAYSQITDSLESISRISLGNSLSTKFLKQLSTHNLLTQLNIFEDFDDINIQLYENFNSTFVRSTEKSIRDEQQLKLASNYKIDTTFTLGLGFGSSIFSDNRKIGINQASSNQAFFLSRIQPSPFFYFVPFFGYLNNRQVLNDDDGLLYGSEAQLKNYNISELIVSSNIKFRNEDISPRKNLIRHYDLKLNSQFDNDISNVVIAGYSKNQKDFYFEADSITSYEFNVTNNIQSRIETNYILQDSLNYPNVFNLFNMNIFGSLNWRKIERETRYKSLQNVNSSTFDSEINELKLDFESVLSYSSHNFNGLLRLIYSERDEKNLAKRIASVSENIYQDRVRLEARKNNNSIRTSLAFIGNLILSRTDMISFSLFHNKLRYDTPSKENFDDRDEMLSIARIKYSKLLNPFFEAFVNTEGTYNQTVYIFSQKSSNNNVNRILKLAAGGIYRGAKFSSANSFEVSANYTVYNFQDLNPNIRSYSFRQFAASDSSNYSFNNKLKLSIFGYLRLSEQGDLRWSEFASRPTRFLREIYLEPRFIVHYSIFKPSLGLRFFSLSTFNYKDNNKIIDSEFRSIGPIIEMMIESSKNLFVRIYGWYEFISLNSKANKEQTNLNIEMTWSF